MGMLTDLEQESIRCGLSIHPEKTKVLTNARRGNRASISLGSSEVQVMSAGSSVKYLGRKFAMEDPVGTEFDNRIAGAWAAFSSRKCELTNKNYPLKNRLQLFNATVGATVLYGTEALALKVDQQRRLQTTQRKMMRIILGAKRRVLFTSLSESSSNSSSSDVVSEDEDVALEPWVDFLKRTTRLVEDKLMAAGEKEWLASWRIRKWRWAGKLVSQNQHKWSYTALLWNPLLHSQRAAGRAQGRPRKRWEEDFQQFFWYKKDSREWREVAANPTEWVQLEEHFLTWSRQHC